MEFNALDFTDNTALVSHRKSDASWKVEKYRAWHTNTRSTRIRHTDINNTGNIWQDLQTDIMWGRNGRIYRRQQRMGGLGELVKALCLIGGTEGRRRQTGTLSVISCLISQRKKHICRNQEM